MSFSIPLNPENLSTEFSPLDDSITYEVQIAKLTNRGRDGEKLMDKNGKEYMRAEYDIVSPEAYRGKRLFDAYIRIPDEILDTDDDTTRNLKRDSGVRIARLIRCFNLDVSSGKFNAEEYIGAIGRIGIKNGDFEGRPVSRVKDYLY